MKDVSKLKVIPLGGLGEIGKNITAIEYENDIIVIDGGLSFPDEDMYGVDLLIPDVSYLLDNKEKVKGMFITHGHEDHIGAIPYILKQINMPLYATKLTIGLIENKLKEHNIEEICILNRVEDKQSVMIGNFKVEFISVTHSIADACALAIHTPVGTILHTGDFKVDYTPIDDRRMDLETISKIGKKGVLLLMADSTNVERRGHSLSEKTIGETLNRIFSGATCRSPPSRYSHRTGGALRGTARGGHGAGTDTARPARRRGAKHPPGKRSPDKQPAPPKASPSGRCPPPIRAGAPRSPPTKATTQPSEAVRLRFSCIR